MLQRFLHRLLGDLVEHQAMDFFPFAAELFRQMPADGFTFPLRVRRDVNISDIFRGALQLRDHFLAGGDRLVDRRKAFVDVDAELALRQIAHVSHRRDDFVVAPEVLVDRFCLRRRFDDDKRFSHRGL